MFGELVKRVADFSQRTEIRHVCSGESVALLRCSFEERLSLPAKNHRGEVLDLGPAAAHVSEPRWEKSMLQRGIMKKKVCKII